MKKRFLSFILVVFVFISFLFIVKTDSFALTCTATTTYTQSKTATGTSLSNACSNAQSQIDTGCTRCTSNGSGSGTNWTCTVSCGQCFGTTSWNCPTSLCNGCLFDSGVSCSTTPGLCNYSSSVNSSTCGSTCGSTCTAGTGSTASSCGGHAYYACTSTSPAPDGTCCDFTYRCSGSSCVAACHVGVSVSFCGGTCGAATPNCNSGITCGACSVACGTGTQSCTYTTYSGGGSCTQVAAPSQSCTGTNCGSGAVCGDGSCNGSETCSTCSTDCGACPVTTYSITGNVFIDTNANGSKDTGEANYTGATVTLSTGATTTTNTSGNYTFSSLAAGSYSVTITTPSGYIATTTNPVSTSVGPSTTANFGMQQVPTYTVSGSVFVDDNKNQVQDGAEANYSGGITISSINSSTGQNAGNITYPSPTSSGTYLISGLAAGTYTISYSLPSGYQLSYPLNGPPPSFTVTVGPGCSVGGSNSASCN